MDLDRHAAVFSKRTRKGKLRKVVREHYLREDLAIEPDGGWSEGRCLVVDTNVVLHQIDFLENASAEAGISNVILTQTVLDEVKHQNVGVYNRVKKMVGHKARLFFVFANEHHIDTYQQAREGETPNDRNDRAIRFASKWFQIQMEGSREVLFLTNDRECLQRAHNEGVVAMKIKDYAEKYCPTFADSLAAEGEAHNAKGAAYADLRDAKGDFSYPEHFDEAALQAGIRDGKFFAGTIHMNRDNAREGWVVVSGDSSSKRKEQEAGTSGGARDVLLSGRAMLNRAMDMDKVVVELLPEAEWAAPAQTIVAELDDDADQPQEEKVKAHDGKKRDSREQRPCGKVVGILKRAWRAYCGSIEEPDNPREQSVIFVPVNKSIPKIRIRTKQAAELVTKRIMVSIDAWPRTSKFPEGHYSRTIGEIGDVECESEVILIEHDVCIREFSLASMRCLPKVGPNGEWDPPAEEIAKRVDLRTGYRVCSIDPPGCKDIDDALHVRPIGNGKVEIGVHIADVTHFVAPNDPLDEEARFRGTSVYLVQKRIDMLPKLLTTDLCSLRGNVERLAFSAIWTLDLETCDILDVRFHKSVIKSVAAMTYLKAQTTIDDETDNSPLAKDLRLMRDITRKLRQKRTALGALTLASPEVKFELDSETHDPVDVGEYQLMETMKMVEEMMLLANISVAKRIQQQYPNCAMLRRHPAPPPSNFEQLEKVSAALGFKLESGSNKALADSLDKMHVEGNPMANKLLRVLATRCMSQAIYNAAGDVESPSELQHYGLAADIYTHFTSPIRRYADVVVHRQLAACLGLVPCPDDLSQASSVKEIATGINHRHRQAQFAGRASTELHAHVFFKAKVFEADAYAMRCRANGIIVFIPKYGLEVPIFLNKGGETWALSEDGMTVSGPTGNIRVLDHLKVRIQLEQHKSHRTNLKVEVISIESGILPGISAAAAPVVAKDKEKPAKKKAKKSDK